MKHHYIITITAAVLLFNASLTGAFENNMATEGIVSKEKTSKDVDKSHMVARHKRAANIRPVDINKATLKQLKTIPGIKNIEAKKIVANRPYSYKQDLLTRNVINKEVYDNIKSRIFVIPNNKNAPKK